MSQYETVEVPFVQIGNRRCLTREQLMSLPWLMDFVGAFPAAFEHNLNLDVLMFIEREDDKPRVEAKSKPNQD